MEDHHFLYAALAVFSLLTLSTVVHGISKKFKIPFAVGLLVSGVLIGAVKEVFDLPILHYFQFSPEIIFYVFLPTLIFESAYHLNFRHFRGVLKEVATLATFGLAISIFIVGGALHYFLDIPWPVSLLFGSLISATDPVAVLAIFKEMRTPRKLSTLVDGESLINDGTALVLFQFFFKVAVVGGAVVFSPKLVAMEGFYLLKSIILGVLVGGIFGVVFSYTIAHSKNKAVQLTLSLVLAHVTFLVAEGLLGVSGILATMTAGLLMGNFGGRKLKPHVKASFSEIWNFLGFISNALIFMLLGIKLAEVNLIENWVPVLLSIFLVIFVARPISVLTSFWVTNKNAKAYEKISLPDQTVIIWGGIRGALAAAAVLLIPSDFVYAEVLQAMTAGVIIATFLLNATTIQFVLKKLGIIAFSHSEKFQRAEAELVVNEEICQYIDSLLERKYIAKSVHKSLKHQYLAEHERVIKKLKKLEKSLRNNQREFEKILTQFALGIELNTYKKLFSLEEVFEERFLVLRDSIHRQIDRLDRDVLPDERQPSHKYAPEIPTNFWCAVLCKKIGFKKLSKTIFTKYRTRRILSRLQHYRARRISSWKVVQDFEKLQKDHPVLRNDVTDKIIKRYRFWNTNAEEKMASLEASFPDIIEPYRFSLAEKACLSRTHEIEKKFFEKGFITKKIYEDLEHDLIHRTKHCESRSRK